MKIAIIGGTGPQGQVLALRFARAGIEVVVGSRDPTRAATTVAEVNAKLPKGSSNIVGLSNIELQSHKGVIAPSLLLNPGNH